MPAPSSSLIEKNPPSLARRTFPFRVQEFPAQWLRDFVHLLPAVAQRDPSTRPVNPHRYEN